MTEGNQTPDHGELEIGISTKNRRRMGKIGSNAGGVEGRNELNRRKVKMASLN